MKKKTSIWKSIFDNFEKAVTSYLFSVPNQNDVTGHLFVCRLRDLQNIEFFTFYLTMVLTPTRKIKHSFPGFPSKTRGTVCHVLAIFVP